MTGKYRRRGEMTVGIRGMSYIRNVNSSNSKHSVSFVTRYQLGAESVGKLGSSKLLMAYGCGTQFLARGSAKDQLI